MKTFKEFLEEAYLIEANNKHGISDDEYAKWRKKVALIFKKSCKK